jgi:transcriptional regulator with PAS, ATPase and Fis domain
VDATVLILGESGTGKELVAKYVHYNGPRADKPMVSINCSALSETLLESELFGHAKGAFTGATGNKVGLFQVANGGTLFLDEVGDMSLDMQKKLLRVLQDGEVRPVGSNESYKVDVRIIAATNQKLRDLMQAGKFREDPYFRLAVLTLDIPPLRERREDIPLLIDYFKHRISGELKRTLPMPSEKIMQKLMVYDFPGNVRELENELRRIFILESEYEWKEPVQHESSREMDLKEMEKRMVLKALESSHGNKSKAAELLGISRRTFYKKLIKYHIY